MSKELVHQLKTAIYSVTAAKAFEAGEEIESLRQQLASRDAEIAELKREMQHYLKSAKDLLKENYDLITKREDGHLHDAEVAKLREHVTLLRDVMSRIAFTRTGKCIDLAQELFDREDWATEALAATEQKE